MLLRENEISAYSRNTCYVMKIKISESSSPMMFKKEANCEVDYEDVNCPAILSFKSVEAKKC